MSTPDRLVAEILAAADNELIGRIRLQKVAYLLEQVGAGSNLRFHYHHYGPYSRDLDTAVDRAKALHGIDERIQHRQSDGMPYSVFVLENTEMAPTAVGELPFETARALVGRFKGKSATVLELAATIHWLAFKEQATDWRREIERRKGVKTQGGRLDEALALLGELQLAPA